MQAIRPDRPGGPEVLKLGEYETETPGAGQILVESAAIGVNYIDVYQRSGVYPLESPLLLGVEGAGHVEALGAGVTGLTVGDRVAYCSVQGCYATHVLVPADRAVRLPDAVSAEDAAALLLQGLTAHYLAHDTFALSPGDTALVHAAAGGVGSLLVQFAKQLGARVIATVSTQAKAELARSAGADEVVLYTQQDFLNETRRLTAGKGVDVVYDSVGVATFEQSLRALKPRGCLALYGQSSGAVGPFEPQRLAALGSLFLTRPTLAHYVQTREELEERSRAVFEAFSSGALRLRIDRRLALADAADAHRALEGRDTTGKVLLIP